MYEKVHLTVSRTVFLDAGGFAVIRAEVELYPKSDHTVAETDRDDAYDFARLVERYEWPSSRPNRF